MSLEGFVFGVAVGVVGSLVLALTAYFLNFILDRFGDKGVVALVYILYLLAFGLMGSIAANGH